MVVRSLKRSKHEGVRLRLLLLLVCHPSFFEFGSFDQQYRTKLLCL
jgi:hypothetical protein